MSEEKNTQKLPTTFERGSQVPSQNKVPKMPDVKPPASQEKKE